MLESKEETVQLNGALKSRHMQMIALGGTIGVGLFMGSSATIKWTGPSVLLAYAFSGLILYIVMRALGEMLYISPTTGSFANLATTYLHPRWGYLAAWSTVFEYFLVGISEVIAVEAYLAFWWPDFPNWLIGIIIIGILCLANLISVKVYGEIEMWFALIKVVTIIVMIMLGFLMIFLGVGNHGIPLGLGNLWQHGGFFTGGIKGFVFSLSIVIAAYQGIELIGITAGEAEDPQKNIVKAIRSIVSRILIFYIGAIFVIVTIYPWNQIGEIGSPFVATFAKFGITVAAGIINFVVLTAALSGCNSGIFSASRMLYTLGLQGDLPKFMTKLSRYKVPYMPVITMGLGILVGFILNHFTADYLGKESNLFVIVFGSSVLPGMIPWFIILFSQLKFRQAHEKEWRNHPFKLPLYPFSNYFALLSLFFILICMFFNPETRISIGVGLTFVSVTLVSYEIISKKR
ncbi:amino acid permease [Vagococcus intermedius]|uniref:Amino acid permease n=1 Tax=Vagococcus intermedius TaxID=2991418 RepID=A0AAF0I8D7_9ENTE|nr:amino acid permease [Vagococcus intermedius]WEG74295.1 amino acid permease [Vagococcus intermedius]WEG76377.1 amino acid permease [Vagococcus intermedius]